MTLQFPLVSNYPNYRAGTISLMSTPDRVQSHPDFDGTGVQIAFIDSGFSNHADLTGRIALHVDASTHNIVEEPEVLKYTRMSWHGQMTSVISAGDGRMSNGRFRGIASGAEVVLIKISTPTFRIKEPDILRGLNWIYRARDQHHIRVVNVSVGGDWHTNDPSNPLHVMVRRLNDEGITVVVASGNSGRDQLVPPASAPQALTIGGYKDFNTLKQISWMLYNHNHGEVYDGAYKPELIAPAEWIVSPLLPDSETEAEIRQLARLLTAQSQEEACQIITEGKQALGLTDEEIEKIDETLYHKLQDRIYHHKVVDANHQYVDGTSVAAPIVCAVIAQMIQANPALSPEQIRTILMDTSKLIDRFEDKLQGAGVLQARRAVEEALRLR